MATSMQELMQQGMDHYNAGRVREAAQKFFQITKTDPTNQKAWLWLASCVDQDHEKRTCLERVISIDPTSETAEYARVGLAQLQPAPSPSQPQPNQWSNPNPVPSPPPPESNPRHNPKSHPRHLRTKRPYQRIDTIVAILLLIGVSFLVSVGLFDHNRSSETGVIIIATMWVMATFGIAMAQSKGHSPIECMIICTLIGPLGVLLLAIIPPNQDKLDDRKVLAGTHRYCPYCHELIRSQVSVCHHCTRDVPPTGTL